MDEMMQPVEEIRILYRKGKRWGYSDLYGEIVIEPVYDEAYFFESSIILLEERLFTAIVKKGEKKYIIDHHNNLLTTGYKEIETKEKVFKGYLFYVVTDSTGKKGLFHDHELIIPTIYDEIELDEDVYFKVWMGNKAGVVNMDHEIIIPAVYDEIDLISGEDDEPVLQWGAKNNGGSKFYTAIKKSLTVAEQDQVLESSLESVAIKIEEESKILNIISNGDLKGVEFILKDKLIIPEYDSILPIGRVNLSGKTFIIDGSDHHFIVSKNGYFGIINENNRPVVSLEMESIERAWQNYYLLFKNGKYGVFHPEEKHQVPVKYDKILEMKTLMLNLTYFFYLYKVLKDGKEGFVGEHGIEFFDD